MIYNSRGGLRGNRFVNINWESIEVEGGLWASRVVVMHGGIYGSRGGVQGSRIVSMG